MYPYFSDLMELNGLKNSRYLEPFVGGAGVALGLLSTNIASDAILNDADYHIHCFWKSVLNENEHFIDKIKNVALSINEWQKQKIIYCNPKKYSIFEVGFSTFYLNRCNRSGILAGSGPIGGYKQSGKWRLDARFNKEALTTRIEGVGTLKGRIRIENMDALVFLRKYLPYGRSHKKVFVYIDPPYVSAGDRLYLNIYSDEDHRQLACYLLEQANLKWVVTYDDNLLIRRLYSSCQKWLLSLGYSLQLKQKSKELLITSEGLLLPNRNKLSSNRWSIVEKIREGV